MRRMQELALTHQRCPRGGIRRIIWECPRGGVSVWVVSAASALRAMELSMSERRAVPNVIAIQYARSERAVKKQILDKLCDDGMAP